MFIFFRQNLIIYNLLKKVYILQRDIMAISMNIHIIISVSYTHLDVYKRQVLLDEAYETIGRINQYVHPEYGVIDHFISNLTGIQNNQVKQAPCLKDVLKHMIDWLGDRDYKVYAWSDSDYSQLQHEIKAKAVSYTHLCVFICGRMKSKAMIR